jgi:TonB-dependent receptor
LAGRGTWKAGLKLVARDKVQDRNNRNYTTGPTFTLAEFGLALPAPARYFDDHTQFGPRLNLPALKQFFADNPARFVFDPLTSLNDSLAQDFTASEQVTAAYGMRTFTSERWSLLAGVRVEHSSGDYTANELLLRGGTFTGNIRPQTGSTSYTDVLPGVHVTFFPRGHLTIRGAVTKTIGRPAYASLVPIKALDDVEVTVGSGIYTGALSLGNPELQPYRSINADASIEYYLGSGLIAVAPFYKHIDNPIYTRSYVQTGVTYEARSYQTLAFSQPTNAEAGHIGGVEFTYQNYFSKLPGAFDGVGVNLNYTLTDSGVTVFGRTAELPFFKQAKHSGTLALLYEKYGVASQLSLSFHSHNLGTVGTNPDSDNYGDTYRVVDFKVSAPITRALRGLVELGNLNNEYRRRYGGIPERRTQDERYSWSLTFGVDWRVR